MEWQPIETAPKDGSWVLGFRSLKCFEDQIQVWRWEQKGSFAGWVDSQDSNDFDEEPTHWMPLPEPPN